MIFRKKKAGFDLSNIIVVVSGLPRSGTSLMMKMLEAGGVHPVTDHEREADEDNPKGYYEFERVKALPEGDDSWLKGAKGKAVKVISALLKHLPNTYEYRVIFMRREIEEILASQKKMLENREEDTERVEDVDMAAMFESHLHEILNWARQNNNLRYVEISYNELLDDPDPQIYKVNKFLGDMLDADAMLEQIDPALYRQRKEAG